MGSPAAKKIVLTIPTYNREKYLRMLLESVPRDIPCYVSDNDGCLKASSLRELSGVSVSSLDSLIPVYENWIRAASLVEEDAYFAITSDDDMYVPGGFDIIRGVIENNPDFDIYIFGHHYIDEFNVRSRGYAPQKMEFLEAPEGFNRFLGGVLARTPSVFFRKKFFEKIGGFDKDFYLTAGDSELIQRALLLGRSVFVPHFVSSYRVWSESSTKKSQATDEWMREIRLWVVKTTTLAEKEFAKAGLRFNASRFGGEVIAANLISGLRNLYERKMYKEAKVFLADNPVPVDIGWRTRLHLYRILLKISIKS